MTRAASMGKVPGEASATMVPFWIPTSRSPTSSGVTTRPPRMTRSSIVHLHIAYVLPETGVSRQHCALFVTARASFSWRGVLAAPLRLWRRLVYQRDPHLTLVDTRHASIQWLDFAEQWDPKSPWHDQRVRLAA